MRIDCAHDKRVIILHLKTSCWKSCVSHSASSSLFPFGVKNCGILTRVDHGRQIFWFRVKFSHVLSTCNLDDVRRRYPSIPKDAGGLGLVMEAPVGKREVLQGSDRHRVLVQQQRILDGGGEKRSETD